MTLQSHPARHRTEAARLADEVRAAETELIECARFWWTSREVEAIVPRIHAKDCDDLAAAVKKLDRAEAAEEQHHMGGAA